MRRKRPAPPETIRTQVQQAARAFAQQVLHILGKAKLAQISAHRGR